MLAAAALDAREPGALRREPAARYAPRLGRDEAEALVAGWRDAVARAIYH
jgi:hypothetical protein